ncbi:hypothetical protein RRG08_037759 [Elysia crispata]|uniref:Uncharacterized protein n=1 Tax=Elysia crispata TaxID=231223 RepID=A0AAE1DU51_9GAST|nr:hypothetical protein RRG08_037759 [Elysia crispata]
MQELLVLTVATRPSSTFFRVPQSSALPPSQLRRVPVCPSGFIARRMRRIQRECCDLAQFIVIIVISFASFYVLIKFVFARGHDLWGDFKTLRQEEI